MPIYKNEKKGTWTVSCYYKDWSGKQLRKYKRGFTTKREASAWEREFLQEKAGDLTMTLRNFVNIYENDVRNRVKENTWRTKETLIRTKILPFMGDMKLNEIQPKDVVAWQNILLEQRNPQGKPYSLVYLRGVHNQLTAVLNHAIRFYGLRENPARKAGNLGKDCRREMEFWTQTQFGAFRKALTAKSVNYYAFQMLYWCGLRVGELFALTEEDFHFQENTVEISKSLQKLDGREVITTPKTVKSNRKVTLPPFLVTEMQEFIANRSKKTERLFPMTKGALRYEMQRVAKLCGEKPIKIHSLRHSHVSLLIEMGLSAVAIAERVGHESIDITFRYAHMFPSKQQEIADRLQNLEMGM